MSAHGDRFSEMAGVRRKAPFPRTAVLSLKRLSAGGGHAVEVSVSVASGLSGSPVLVVPAPVLEFRGEVVQPTHSAVHPVCSPLSVAFPCSPDGTFWCF